MIGPRTVRVYPQRQKANRLNVLTCPPKWIGPSLRFGFLIGCLQSERQLLQFFLLRALVHIRKVIQKVVQLPRVLLQRIITMMFLLQYPQSTKSKNSILRWHLLQDVGSDLRNNVRRLKPTPALVYQVCSNVPWVVLYCSCEQS